MFFYLFHVYQQTEGNSDGRTVQQQDDLLVDQLTKMLT